MASLLSVLCTASIVVLAFMDIPVEADRQFKVGWQEPAPNDTAFYNQWAARNSPINTFDDGNSTVILDSPGFFYFVSGIEDHCQNGEKLIVEVMSPHSIPNSPPSIIYIPPQGFSALAPAPSHSHSSRLSASIVLGSVFMALLTCF
ncbi:Early nodulin protein 1 [Spatholobus suberectus]|nr:Early nodulin protein 1 [Spatholobus suberectus]